MDNTLDPAPGLSMSQISVMSNVKEEKQSHGKYFNKIILLGMIIFVLIVVGVSVVNFGSFVKKEGGNVVNAKNIHNQDVQRLTNQ